jgi:hypothetical protein
MFQGLDFTDQGYWLTGYQRIFQDPESVSSMMTTWLSLIIGGLVEKIGLGAISFRIAFVIVIWMTLWLAYRFLRECFGREEILFPLFVTLVYVTKWGVNWISYNDLSALFFLGASLVLWYGLQAKNYKLIFLAGLILGVSVYLRIPNIAGVTLSLAIFYAGWLGQTKITSCLKLVFLFFGGYILGLLVILFFMHLMGHLPYFSMGVSELIKQASHSNYHHSFKTLLNLIFVHHIKSLIFAMCSLCLVIVVVLLKKLAFKINFFRSNLWFLILYILAFVVVVQLAGYLEHRSNHQFALPGFCYAILLLGTFLEVRGGSRKLALLYFIALLILFIVPLGSASGIKNAIHGSWLALPAALLALFRIFNRECDISLGVNLFKNNGVFKNNLIASFIVTIIGMTILLFSLRIAYLSTYRDSESRIELKYPIDISELRGIYTSKARSKSVEEIILKLRDYVKPGDKLLAITDIPMLNYLTNTKPFLSYSWTRLMWEDQLAEELREKKDYVHYPVVVRTKGSSMNKEWPSVTIDKSYQGGGEFLIREFMNLNHYQKHWENDWFEIWVVEIPKYSINGV